MSWCGGLWWNVYSKYYGICYWGIGHVTALQVEKFVVVVLCLTIIIANMSFISFSIPKLFYTSWRSTEVGWVPLSGKISSRIVKDGLETSRYHHKKVTSKCNGDGHGTWWIYKCCTTFNCYRKVRRFSAEFTLIFRWLWVMICVSTDLLAWN